METVRRYDRSTLNGPRKTHQGFLKADGFLSRSGILEYRLPDGTIRRELRLPEDAFSKEAIESHALAPVTLRHPPEGRVTPENSKQRSVGMVGESVERMGDFVKGSVLVTDAEAIRAVESGECRELSCGYTCEVDPTPGTYKGQPYDALQRNVRVNHLALVERARAGHEAALKLDAADGVMTGDSMATVEVVPTANTVKGPGAHDLVLNAPEPASSAGTHPLGGEDFQAAVDALTSALKRRNDCGQKLSSARKAYEQARGDAAAKQTYVDCHGAFTKASRDCLDCQSKVDSFFKDAAESMFFPGDTEHRKDGSEAALQKAKAEEFARRSLNAGGSSSAASVYEGGPMTEESVKEQGHEDEHIGFDELVKKLVGEGHDEESAKKIAASIGQKKYGAAGMAAKAAAGKRADGEEERADFDENQARDEAAMILPDLMLSLPELKSDGSAETPIDEPKPEGSDPWWEAAQAAKGHAAEAHQASHWAHRECKCGSHQDAVTAHRVACQSWREAGEKGAPDAGRHIAMHTAFAHAHEMAAVAKESSPV